MAEPVTLEVFPNTGHQYFSIPLVDLIPEKNPMRQDTARLEEIARRNLGRQFEPLDPMLGWIRYQYDYDDEKGRPLLKLAIETNLGLDNRGFHYDTEEVDEEPEEESIPTRFAARNEQELWEFGGEIPIKSVPSVQGGTLPLDLKIKFKKPGGIAPIDVDLIVDLGNTRTAAVLLEEPTREGKPLRIAPLRVVPRGSPFPEAKEISSSLEDSAIIPSWMVLHQTVFSHLEPPGNKSQSHVEYESFRSAATGAQRYQKKSSFPQAFVELSPALVGGGNSKQGAASILAKSSPKTDAPFFLSSPKRYVWDDEPQDRPYWFALRNSEDILEGDSALLPMGGLIRYFMEPTGADVCSETARDNILNLLKPDADPTYPRRAAICWFALSIIEAAYRQMNAPAYMRSMASVTMPRRLRWIRVTFPAGWTGEEKDFYLAEWKRAIELFKLTHLENPSAPARDKYPALTEDEMDEAVCSQLPIIYAQLQTLGQDAQRWIELFGNGEKVTVMNLDIGGGTTDMSIIQYENANSQGPKAGVSLASKLLFRFGHSIAGDMVVKSVIERVLLPAWIKASDRTNFFAAKPMARKALQILFGPGGSSISGDPFMSKKLARITRLVLATLATRLLQRVVEGDDPNVSWEPLDVKAMLQEKVIIGSTLEDLNKLCVETIRSYCRLKESDAVADPFSASAKIVVNPESVNECIKDVFSGVFHHLGIVAAEFKCHMVIVSGKPSELPLVRQLLDEALPILPQRIITVKNFPAGRWYPFSTPDGKIQDAKTCTVVGAALFQEILNGALKNFSITPFSGDAAEDFSKQYFWGIIPPKGGENSFYEPRTAQNSNGFLLFSAEDYNRAGPAKDNRIECVKTFTGVPLDCRIGRQIRPIKNVAPDPVYEIRWKAADNSRQPTPPLTATVKLKWVSIKGKGERLELVSLTPNNPNVAFAELKLNTLPPPSNPLSGRGDFWMDSPEFETSGLFSYLPKNQQ